MAKTKLERQFPALFAECSVEGPRDMDDLIRQLREAGMTAAAWFLEGAATDDDLEEEIRELEATLDGRPTAERHARVCEERDRYKLGFERLFESIQAHVLIGHWPCPEPDDGRMLNSVDEELADLADIRESVGRDSHMRAESAVRDVLLARELIREAMQVHIYSEEDGESPDEGCRYAEFLNRTSHYEG